jgi:hypothetical protein
MTNRYCSSRDAIHTLVVLTLTSTFLLLLPEFSLLLQNP